MSHRDTRSRVSDMVILTVLRGRLPMRFDATSAKSAVAVHDTATPNAIISPTNMPQ